MSSLSKHIGFPILSSIRETLTWIRCYGRQRNQPAGFRGQEHHHEARMIARHGSKSTPCQFIFHELVLERFAHPRSGSESFSHSSRGGTDFSNVRPSADARDKAPCSAFRGPMGRTHRNSASRALLHDLNETSPAGVMAITSCFFLCR